MFDKIIGVPVVGHLVKKTLEQARQQDAWTLLNNVQHSISRTGYEASRIDEDGWVLLALGIPAAWLPNELTCFTRMSLHTSEDDAAQKRTAC